MKKVIFNGEPGERWTNDTPKVQYQFVAELRNTCGACLQYHMAIASFWPIPIHRGCRCRQAPVRPGQAAEPWVDFRELLDGMDPSQRRAAVGSTLYKLVKRGVVKWDDAVTGSRVRTLQEVVARNKVGVDAMVKAGARKPIAEAAWRAVNTPELKIVDARHKALVAGLERAGVSRDKTIEDAAEKLADRITIRLDLGGAAGGPATIPMPPNIPPGDLATLLGLNKTKVKAALKKTPKPKPKPAGPLAPEFPASRSEVQYGFWRDDEQAAKAAKAAARRVLGEAADKLASVVGAPDGSTVVVQEGAGDSIDYEIRHPALSQVLGAIVRRGEKLIHKPEFMNVRKSERGAGIGARIHGRRVHWGREAGVSEIQITAARGPDMNGYAVWPIVGYDGPLPKSVASALPDPLKAATTIQELLSLPGGPEWWAEHGDTMDMTFDLGDGSRSLEIWRRHWNKKPRKTTDD